MDECSKGGSICPEDSSCFNTNGSYACVCDKGYFHLRIDNLNTCMGKFVVRCMGSWANLIVSCMLRNCIRSIIKAWPLIIHYDQLGETAL